MPFAKKSLEVRNKEGRYPYEYAEESSELRELL
jgi:hypothetical protein